MAKRQEYSRKAVEDLTSIFHRNVKKVWWNHTRPVWPPLWASHNLLCVQTARRHPDCPHPARKAGLQNAFFTNNEIVPQNIQKFIFFIIFAKSLSMTTMWVMSRRSVLKGCLLFFWKLPRGGNVKRGRMFFSPTFINHAYYENRSNSLADHH